MRTVTFLGLFLSSFCDVAECIVLLGAPVLLGRVIAIKVCPWSAMVFVWVVSVKWHPPEYKDPMFPSRPLHCNKMINDLYCKAVADKCISTVGLDIINLS